MDTILKEIIQCADPVYRDFQARLLPTVDKETVLGVRAPMAHKIAKKYANTATGTSFLNALPHKYYDENIVHAFMLGSLRCSHGELCAHIRAFLPHVDNWAVCDGLCAHLKNFFKSLSAPYPFVLECVKSDAAYTVRFGLVCLLNYYIDKEHTADILNICKSIKSGEYYVSMAVAWLLSFCLIKEYSLSLPLLQSRVLDKWVHNKAIQKACESHRISNGKKTYLRSLKIK